MTPSVMKHMLTAGVAALILATTTPEAPAAIPLKTERALQHASPEHLHIEVLKVKKTRRVGSYKVTVTAKVRKVARTATDVKPGAIITLAYSTPAVPTPSAPPGLVDAGKHYEAFLKKDGETYDAAAASGTFRVIPAPQAPGNRPVH